MKHKTYIFFFIITIPIALTIALSPFRSTLASLHWITLSTLAVCVLLNIIFMVILYARKLDSHNLRAKLLEHKDNLSKNYSKYRFQISFVSFLSALYIGFYLIFVPVLNVSLLRKCLALFSENIGLAVILSLLTVALIIYECIIFSRAFQPVEYNFGPNIRLYHNNAPRIWSICDSAMRRLGMRKPMMLLAVPGCNACIVNHKKYIQISIGYELLPLLKPEELHAVFLHEFSHALRKDAAYNYRINNRKSRWQLLSTRYRLFPCFLFIPLGALLINLSSKFDFVASYRIEMETDAMITGEENRQNFVNALAKIDLYSYHQYKLPLENSGNYTDSKYNFIDANHKRFLDAYSANKEKWELVIRRQLPARIDTHPNLAERMQNFMIDNFSVDFSISDKEYLTEIKNLQETIVEAVQNRDERACELKYLYGIYNSIITQYESNSGGDSCSLIDVAKAYFMTCNYDKALELYEKILVKNPVNPEALFHKGVILCDRCDDSGMQSLLALLDNNNYFEQAYFYLVMYVQYQALKEEKERLREFIHDKSDNYLDGVIKNSARNLSHELSAKKIEYLKALLSAEPCCGHALILRKSYKNVNYHYLLLSVNTNIAEKQDWFIQHMMRTLSDECPEVILRLIPHKPLPRSLRKSEYILKSELQPINDLD